MLLLRREARERTTPIGALHRVVMRLGEADRVSSRPLQRWLDGVAYVDAGKRLARYYGSG